MARKDKTENTEAQTETTVAETKTPKSIVPSKYAGKYKGSNDALSAFIAEQCNGEDKKVDFAKFFDLARKNGVPEDQIAKYEPGIAAKTNGVAGRARMSIGNILRGVARKGKGLVGLDGETYDVQVAPAPTREKAEAAA